MANASHDNRTKGTLQPPNHRSTISTALCNRVCCCLQNASSLSSRVTEAGSRKAKTLDTVLVPIINALGSPKKRENITYIFVKMVDDGSYLRLTLETFRSALRQCGEFGGDQLSR